MPLIETLPIGADTAQWTVWGTVARVVVTDPAAFEPATAIVRAELAAVDAACSRFRPDTELAAVCRSTRPMTVSPLLADLVTAALEAARQTDGTTGAIRRPATAPLSRLFRRISPARRAARSTAVPRLPSI